MSGGAIHFLPIDLHRWEGVNADALALSFFLDERPLRGAAGLADWRLCGRLSALLRASRIAGKRGESTMMPPAGRRLAFPRLVLFGLGDSSRFDEACYREEVRRLRSVLGRAGVRRYALQLPGRATGLVAARRALEMWLDEAATDDLEVEVTILETAGGQKEMAEALRSRAKSG